MERLNLLPYKEKEAWNPRYTEESEMEAEIRTVVCKPRKSRGCPKLEEAGVNLLRPQREPSLADVT